MPRPLILVVDNRPAQRKFIRESLAATGYDVAEADNADSALMFIKADRPALCIIEFDAVCPGGEAVLKKITSSGEDQPGVLLVGRVGAVEDSRRFLAKPLTAEALIAAVELALAELGNGEALYDTDREMTAVEADRVKALERHARYEAKHEDKANG